jgi:small-conductance mechanosensitive channel
MQEGPACDGSQTHGKPRDPRDFGALAIIIILENLGVHLTVVWTTLGVGSVAVALALQETLVTCLRGISSPTAHPPADYIKLDSGHEGYVVRIGWRSTTIRTCRTMR